MAAQADLREKFTGCRAEENRVGRRHAVTRKDGGESEERTVGPVKGTFMYHLNKFWWLGSQKRRREEISQWLTC